MLIIHPLIAQQKYRKKYYVQSTKDFLVECLVSSQSENEI